MSTNEKPENENESPLTDPPPFFNGWISVYLVLIGFLILQIFIYYFLTETLK